MPFDGTMELPKQTKPTVYDDMKRSYADARQSRALGRLNAARQSVIVLDKLAALFADEKRWTTRTYRDGDRYCLVGGVRHVRSGLGRGDNASMFLAQAIEARMGKRVAVTRFNDDSKYPDVMAVISEAMQLARTYVEKRE